MTSKVIKARRPWLRRFVFAGLLLFVMVVLWSGWAELNPQKERALRVQLQDELEARLPEAMQPPAERYGLFLRTTLDRPAQNLRVVLVHGLDEPGGIWADLLPVLEKAGFETLEFRYPNDQGIDLSADLLASVWTEIPDDPPVVLIGHSMGGLVIRDFVTRYDTTENPLAGASVEAVILVTTPNQGSDLARMRVLLELRDQWAAAQQPGFSPLAGLQDGTGAAKIDLQPGSQFLTELNARPWPESVAISIIGGILLESTPALGDGVVPTESLKIEGESPPILVSGSHRGVLARFFDDDDEPPAIAEIMSLLATMGSGQRWGQSKGTE